MSRCTMNEMEVVVGVQMESPVRVQPEEQQPEKEIRYRCGECEDSLFCEMGCVHYQDGYKKPSDDREGKYIWVCPGDKPSTK